MVLKHNLIIITYFLMRKNSAQQMMNPNLKILKFV